MSSVLNRVTKEYIESANTDLYPIEEWILNPDVSQVINEVPPIPTQYWIIPAVDTDPVLADRVSWKRDTKLLDLDAERDRQLELPIQYPDNSGIYYSTSSFVTPMVTFLVLSMVSGYPVAVAGTNLVPVKAIDGSEQLTQDDLVNLYAKYTNTRISIAYTYDEKVADINALTTEEEIDNYDIYSGWPAL